MAETAPDLEVQIGISINKLAAQLAQAEARMNKTAANAERKFMQANQHIAGGFGRTNRAANAFAGGGLRQVSLQMSQVAQQGAVTGDYMRALAVQLPDLALAFGPLGIAIGAVAGSLIPLGLEMLKTGQSSEEMADRAKELASAIKEYTSAVEAASVPTAELEKKYGRATDAARDFLAALRDIEGVEAVEALNARFEDLTRTIANVNGDRSFVQAAADVEAYLSRLEELQQAARNSSLTPELEQELFDLNNSGILEYSDALNALADDFSLTIDNAARLADALKAVAEAEGNPAQQARAAAQVRDVLQAMLGDYASMTEAQRALFREMVKTEEQAASLARQIDLAETNMLELIRAVSTAVGGMDGLADSAKDLWDNVKGAAEAAWEYVGAMGQRARAGDPAYLQRGLDMESYAIGQAATRDRIAEGYELPEDKPKAARGGGGSRTASEPFFAEIEATITALERQIQTVGKSAAEIAELEARWTLLDEAQRRGVTVTDELSASIDQQAARVGRLAREYELAQDKMEFMADMKSELLDLATGVQSLGDAFADLAQMIARAAFEAALFGTGPFSGLFGGSGTGFIGAITGKGFASGGFTGLGGKHDPAGIVHKGEYVFDQEATRRIGVGNLDALANGMTPLRPDFSGMQVSAPATPQAAPVVEANFRAIVVDRYEDRFAALAKTPLFEKEVMAVVERNRSGFE